MIDVLVVGSINADVAFRSPRFAMPGLTVVAHNVTESPGGKGANQAVAAARAGASTRLVGAVGDDRAGRTQLAALADEGVDPGGVLLDREHSTGTAFVVVVPSGENAIIVHRGANANVDLDRVRAEVESTTASVVLLQSEVGVAIIDSAAEAVADAIRRVRLVVNNGPWVPLAARTLALADPLVVNEHEAREACPEASTLSGVDLANAVQAAYGSASVVVTQGAAGVAVSGAPGLMCRPPAGPAVVDTVGAGDAFTGALTAALARGTTLVEAVSHGQRAGADAVGHRGAR